MRVHVLVMAAAATMALAIPAAANDRAYKYDGRHHGRHGIYDIGYTNGYEEGIDAGRRDARQNKRFNFHDESRYRRADHKYRRSYGPRHVYAGAFRRGFEAGYREAYRAHDRYGRGHGRVRKTDPYYGGYHGDAYDWRSDGRHRHRSHSGWCSARH